MSGASTSRRPLPSPGRAEQWQPVDIFVFVITSGKVRFIASPSSSHATAKTPMPIAANMMQPASAHGMARPSLTFMTKSRYHFSVQCAKAKPSVSINANKVEASQPSPFTSIFPRDSSHGAPPGRCARRQRAASRWRAAAENRRSRRDIAARRCAIELARRWRQPAARFSCSCLVIVAAMTCKFQSRRMSSSLRLARTTIFQLFIRLLLTPCSITASSSADQSRHIKNAHADSHKNTPTPKEILSHHRSSAVRCPDFGDDT